MAAPTATVPDAVEHLQSVLAYQFTNPRILLEALRAAGSGYNLNPSSVAIDGNKRLARLGDAVMKMVVLDDWFALATQRVVANQHVARIGSPETLSGCGRNIGLENCISTNPSQRFELPSSAVISRTLQALLGAIWLDSQRSFHEVRRVLQTLGLLPMPNA